MPPKPPAAKRTAGTRRSQTVERAGLVLACFSASRPQLTLAELAEQLELNQSTVYRYALALQQAGLLERDERRGGYRLGLRVVELAGIVLNQLEVRKQALDEMDHLRDDLDLDVTLGVLFEGDVLIVAQSFRKDLPALYTGMGRRQPAHSSGMGKLLLAQLPDDHVLAIVEKYGWRPMTGKSISTPEALFDALHDTRERGYAIADEEVRQGIFGIACPVRDFSGTVKAALGVTGRFPMLEDAHRERVLLRLRVAANRISFRLGFHDEGPYR